MGVIQQSVNQAFSMAGLARQLYQQSPGYQKKMEEREYKKSTQRYQTAKQELKNQLKGHPEGYAGHEELKVASEQLEERRSNELFARGKYDEWAKQKVQEGITKTGRFGRAANIVEYDEQRAQEANDRAEDTARQIMAQRDTYKSVLEQLRGVNRVSQAFLHKEGNK